MLAVIIRLCDFVPTLKEIVLEEERKHAPVLQGRRNEGHEGASKCLDVSAMERAYWLGYGNNLLTGLPDCCLAPSNLLFIKQPTCPFLNADPPMVSHSL